MSKNKIHIPEPCHENWDKMTPQEQGRFCASCAKVVHDVTKLSDDEILKTYEENNASLCIRIPQSRLVQSSKTSKARWWIAAAMVAWFGAKQSFAKILDYNPQVSPSDSTQSSKLDSVVIRGTVVDTFQAKHPIAFATVEVLKDNRSLGGAYTDSEGKYQIFLLNAGLYRDDTLTLKVKYVGYGELEKKIAARPLIDTTIYMEAHVINVDELRIIPPRMPVMGVMITGKMVRPDTFRMEPIKTITAEPVLDPYDTKTYRAGEIERYNLGRDID